MNFWKFVGFPLNRPIFRNSRMDYFLDPRVNRKKNFSEARANDAAEESTRAHAHAWSLLLVRSHRHKSQDMHTLAALGLVLLGVFIIGVLLKGGAGLVFLIVLALLSIGVLAFHGEVDGRRRR